MPPQYYLLHTLALILQGDISSHEQRETVRGLACGAFGKRVFNPRILPQKDPQGRMILTYEDDETRGGALGARHRAIVKQGKGEVS